jgi:hypothetical protein
MKWRIIEMENIIEEFKNCDWVKVILTIVGLTPLIINDSTNLFGDKYEFAKCYITALSLIYLALFTIRQIMSAESLQPRSKFAEAIRHMSNEELQEELKIYDQYMEIIEEEIDSRINCRMNGTNED